MAKLLIPILGSAFLLLGGCAGTTPIKNIALPPVTTIGGTVTELNENGFTLTDDSGSIFVKIGSVGEKKLKLSIDEKVKVYGNLQGGQKKIFDGYVIRKSTGEQVIITNPSPQIGCVIQSSFQ